VRAGQCGGMKMPQPDANRGRSYDGAYMEVGKRAEEAVLRWLGENPDILDVRDCRSQRVGQEADFDFSITGTDGVVTLAEVKSDKLINKTGNMIFEIARVNHTAPHDRAVTLGWSARSPATWCVFYCPPAKKIYVVRFEDLRKCFQHYSRKVRKNVRMKWVPTDSIKSTLIALIPEEFWRDVTKVYDLPEPGVTSF